jgi:5-methylcytosine-specific restriction protein A
VSFSDLLKYTLEVYLKEKTYEFKDNEFNQIYTRDFPKSIKEELNLDSDKYLVNSSCGKGNWATIPWIAIFDKEITISAGYGYYVVILFSADMSGFYLTLNQGYTWFENTYGKAARKNITEMTKHIRTIVNSDFETEIDLKSPVDLAKGYGLGAIYSKYYAKNSQDINNIKIDVYKFLKLLEEVKKAIGNDSIAYNQKILYSNKEPKLFYLKGDKNDSYRPQRYKE